MSLKFTIPFLPASMNQIYRIIPFYSQRRVKVQLKEDVLMWKSKAKEYIPKWKELESDSLISISFKFHGNWYTKKDVNKVKTIDMPNLLKVVIDTIAEKLGFNDCRIFEMREMKKVQNNKEEKVEVELSVLK